MRTQKTEPQLLHHSLATNSREISTYVDYGSRWVLYWRYRCFGLLQSPFSFSGGSRGGAGMILVPLIPDQPNNVCFLTIMLTVTRCAHLITNHVSIPSPRKTNADAQILCQVSSIPLSAPIFDPQWDNVEHRTSVCHDLHKILSFLIVFDGVWKGQRGRVRLGHAEINQINWSYCSQRATHTPEHHQHHHHHRLVIFILSSYTSIFDLRFSCDEYSTVLLSIHPMYSWLVSLRFMRPVRPDLSTMPSLVHFRALKENT